MTMPPEVVPLVRQFASNGLKYLFSRGDNVADLLRWRVPELAARIDFRHMVVQPDTFISSGFAQMESDVLLRAPFRGRKGALIDVYVLIENQAEPDELMAFRALRYVMGVYERQVTDWQREHEGNLRGLRFHPVLPIVFYSGTRTWGAVTPFRELVHEGQRFGGRLPAIEPEFIPLALAGERELTTQAGAIGSVLHVVQQRRRGAEAFRAVLRQAVGQVDQLPGSARERIGALLWYLHALVYHERDPSEYAPLVEFIRDTVREARRKEVAKMGKTIADALREEGREEGSLGGKRSTLLRQLRLRFKTIPQPIETLVQAEEDEGQIDAWLDAFATARKLSDIPFTHSK